MVMVSGFASEAAFPPFRPRRHPPVASILLLLATVFPTPAANLSSLNSPGSMVTTLWNLGWTATGGVGLGLGLGVGVSAVPCIPRSSTPMAGVVQQVAVSADAGLNLTDVFNCEDGEFNVTWTGVVNVTNTIVIGSGTTVRISGSVSSSSTTTTDSTSSSGSSSRSRVEINKLTSRLNLPQGLSAAAVGLRPVFVKSDADSSTSSSSLVDEENGSFGSIFRVNRGQLFLERLAVRGGLASNSTLSDVVSGGGIDALNSNVTVVGCEFEDNFAELDGGGIHASYSRIIVVDSVFRNCRAGTVSEPEDDAESAGGAIRVELTDVLIDGCLFEQCYASNKGGAMHQGVGKITVLDSVFYENFAGSGNKEAAEELGEGGALSLTVCTHSFDGLSACGANDSLFINNNAGRKGGALAIGSGSGSSYVEFHRCTFGNSSVGEAIKDDPQGEGGAISMGNGTILVLSQCAVTDNYCGHKGAGISLSQGDDWIDYPGAVIILRNSAFINNTAGLENSGVLNVGSFASVVIEGGGNTFENNSCGSQGGVVGASKDSRVTVHGGFFRGNEGDAGGGVFWTKGELNITGGRFYDNTASEGGGVIFASGDSSVVITGAVFEGNEGSNGGVAYVSEDADMFVEGGSFKGNTASTGGGAFFAGDGGNIEITGGTFVANEADFGGFLYKKGSGKTTCTGASIVGHNGVDGGAIYAVDGAELYWECDLRENEALSGTAVYAREYTTVTLRGVSVVGNVVARGSVVFVVASTLMTYQVVFNDTLTDEIEEMLAVQADSESTYYAEDTTFDGFKGETVIFSEGTLYLDGCDFSGCSAPVLVASDTTATTIIRNAVLGDLNYEDLVSAASSALTVPTAESLVNVDVSCDGAGSVTGTDFPCSPGSICLNGDVGVFCECYERRSTGTETCLNANVAALSLVTTLEPNDTFYPSLVEGELTLSLEDADPEVTGTATTSSLPWSSLSVSSPGNLSNGVVWNVSAISVNELDWTVFPATGLLLPGMSVHIRVVGVPSPLFDGSTSVTFVAGGIGSISSGTPASDDSISLHTDVVPTEWSGDSSSRSSGDEAENLLSQSMEVTFYHCYAGNMWNPYTASSSDDTCELCTEVTEGDADGYDCSNPGVSTLNLPIMEGYWRASIDSLIIRECLNEDACKGGTSVASVDEYCNSGYEGPYCAVCSSNYGSGVANACHLCTASLKGTMYFLLALGMVVTLVVAALLVVYLIGGRVAVSTTVTTTWESVRTLPRRGSGLLLRSDAATPLDTGAPSGRRPRDRGGNGITDESIDKSGVVLIASESEGATTTTTKIERNASSGKCHRRIASTRVGAVKSARVGGSTLRAGGTDIVSPGRSREKPTDDGLENAFAVTTATTTPPEADNSGGPDEATTTAKSSLETVPGVGRGYMVATAAASSAKAEADTEHTGAVSKNASMSCREEKAIVKDDSDYDGEVSASARPVRRRLAVGGAAMAGEGRDPTKKTAATKIGERLGQLPLSKLKIVIVVWQISSAFAEITQVPFPPVYERFLSIIGLFSFDLGWILSAACLTVDIDFYDKLLIGTIGPIILLCLLGVTFYLGARPRHVPRPSDDRFRHSSASNAGTNRTEMAPGSGSSTGHNDAGSHGVGGRVGGVWTQAWRTLRRTRRGGSSANANSSTVDSTSSSGVTASITAHPTRGRCSSASSAGRRKRNAGVAPRRPPLPFTTGRSRGGASGGDVNEAQRSPPLSSDPTDTRVGKSQRSARSIWKAGPSDVDDSEQNHLWWLFARHTTMTLIILYLVYTQVSTVVFQTFACQSLDEIGKSYLRADFRIQCNTTKHKAYKIYGIVMICLYPIGIPAAFCYFLVRQRSRINPPTDKDLRNLRGPQHVVQEKMNQRKNDLTVAPTSFLWNAYYPNRYYYEVCECIRRLLLTGVLVFVVADSPGQVALSCVFAFVSLLAFELLRPHADRLDMQLYRTGCLVIFFTNFLALMIKAGLADPDSSGSAVYSVALIIANILFFLSVWWNSWATIRATFSRRHVQEVILGVGIVGEERMDSFLGPKKDKKKRRRGCGTEKNDDFDPARSSECEPSVAEDSVDLSRHSDRGLSRPSVTGTAAVLPASFWETGSYVKRASPRESGAPADSAKHHPQCDASLLLAGDGAPLVSTAPAQAARSPPVGTHIPSNRDFSPVGCSTSGSGRWDAGPSSPSDLGDNATGSRRQVMRRGTPRSAISAKWDALSSGGAYSFVSPVTEGGGSSNDEESSSSLHMPAHTESSGSPSPEPGFGDCDRSAKIVLRDCSFSSGLAGSATVGPASRKGGSVGEEGHGDLL